MEKNNKIKKALSKKLTICILATLMFVCGVPLIIFSAINSWWILLAVGIVFAVFGFYGAPILWTKFGELKATKSVVDLIYNENILNVKDLSSTLQINEKQVKEHIKNAISNGYLSGFSFDGTTLVSTESLKIKSIDKSKNKCPNCGATIDKNENGYFCPYCNTKFN